VPVSEKIILRIDEFDRLTNDLGWDNDAKRAMHIGISQASLSRVRSGERQPSSQFVHRVLTALQAPYGALFTTRTDEPAPTETAVA
jgi:transcriptional regulator with XRE-family HTH domain